MILYRYLIGEFLKPLLFTTVTFGGIVMISEFFRELSYYLENKVAFSAVFAYLLYNLPWWCIQVLPVAVLLAVLFSLGGLARHQEITAVKAAGISLWRVVALFMLCGALLGAADLALRELVIPRTVQRAEHIRDTRIHHKDHSGERFEYYNHVVSLPGNGRMTIGYLNLRDRTMTNVVADFFNDQYALQRQVVAASAQWTGTGWRFSDGIERRFSSDSDAGRPFRTADEVITLPPESFIIKRLRPELLSTPAFFRHIDMLRTVGAPTEKERIQLNLRFSSVFSHMIVMLMGIPFAVGLGSRHGKLISFTFALIFAFVYWGVQAVGQSLGENGFVSPFIAAWLGNVLFGSAGIWLMARIQR